GPTITLIFSVLFVGVSSSWTASIYVGIILLVIQEIEAKVLTPVLMKKFMDLPPVLVLVALLAGGALFGFLGTIFAVPVFGISYNSFIRTTDVRHIKAAEALWKACQENGDIYKKNYKIKYCVGCELEKTDSELVNGKCSIHPNLEIEIIEEENYFFKYSNYQEK